MQETIGFLINDTARMFRRMIDAEMRDTGITGLQLRFMVYVSRNPGINQRALADIVEVEPITLSRMVDRLAKTDIVERRPDPNDRRAWQLFLTETGETITQKLRERGTRLSENAMEGLTASERNTLKDALLRIRCNLSRQETGDDR